MYHICKAEEEQELATEREGFKAKSSLSESCHRAADRGCLSVSD
jgi:hypothetical protein